MDYFSYDSDEMLRLLRIVDDVQRLVKDEMDELRKFACSKTKVKAGDSLKTALQIDQRAQARCKFGIEKGPLHVKGICVSGEEGHDKKLPDNTLNAVVDMIDGTDHLEMGLPNWCSALVVFDPMAGRVVLSIVALATGEIYFAHADKPGAFVFSRQGRNMKASFDRKRQLAGPSTALSLGDASGFSFYGQKRDRLLDNPRLRKLLKRLGDESRILNISGNPVIVRLADRPRNEEGEVVGKGFDVVFDTSGQKPHDFVPAVYIAMKAGACVYDVESGGVITESDLVRFLCSPDQRQTYVIAATSELAREVAELFRPDPPVNDAMRISVSGGRRRSRRKRTALQNSLFPGL